MTVERCPTRPRQGAGEPADHADWAPHRYAVPGVCGGGRASCGGQETSRRMSVLVLANSTACAGGEITRLNFLKKSIPSIGFAHLPRENGVQIGSDRGGE